MSRGALWAKGQEDCSVCCCWLFCRRAVSLSGLRRAEYTIVKQEEIPEEISELMEQKKKNVFQMTYQVGDIRYLMKGYGEQLTGGYSIQVEEVSESENAVFCKTRLIGPEKADAGSEPSYPCIVLKIRETEKPIEFLGFIIK